MQGRRGRMLETLSAGEVGDEAGRLHFQAFDNLLVMAETTAALLLLKNHCTDYLRN
jgi:hypothetical protein